MSEESTRLSEEQTRIITACLMVLAAVAIAGVLIFTRSVMIPFILAIFIVSIVSPIVDYQVIQLKLSRTVAVTVTLFLVLACFFLFSLFLIGTVQNAASTATDYGVIIENFGRRINELVKAAGPLGEWLGLDDPDRITEIVNGLSRDLAEAMPTLASRTAGRAVDLAASGFFVVLFVIFLLAGRDPHAIRKGIYAEVDQKIRSYIGTKVALSSLTGILVWLALSFFGLKFASVFGLLAFLLNFIPSVGSVIATILPIPVAVVQFEKSRMLFDTVEISVTMQILGVILIPGMVQMVIGNVVEPKLMGKGLDLHPVTVVLMLAFWTLLWGPIGAVLAVPITAILRIVLMRFEAGQTLGRLLAGQLPGADQA